MFAVMRNHIRDIVMGPDPGLAVVACDVEDDDVIFGWAVATIPRLNQPPGLRFEFVWVRRGMRSRGIASSLVADIKDELDMPPESQSYYSIHTKSVDALALPARWKMRYRPWKM